MEDHTETFDISYPVWTVTWDGKVIRKRSDADCAEQMDMMCELGLHEVMLTGYHLEEDSDFDPETETLRIGAMLRERGLTANQHHSHVATLAEPGTDQRNVLDHFKRCLDWTANLNSSAMVIHLGKPDGRFASAADDAREMERLCLKHSKETVLKQTIENLHKAGEFAAERGVRICVENLPDGISTWGTLSEIVEAADSEMVGYCLDAGHSWCSGINPARWVPIMGRKLFVTHFHDNHGQKDEHLSPGFGTIPWDELLLALRDNFHGTVNFEVNGWYGMEPLEGHQYAIEFWRTLEKQVFRHSGKG